MGDTWQLAARVRRDFADMVEGLDDAQLDGPTLSGDWTARHILGHLVFIAEMKIPSFFVAMAKAGFNYDKMADIQARKNAERPLDDLLSSLRARAARSAPMPGFAEGVTVADVAVHTQDIRRPNNIAGTFDDDVLTSALDALATDRVGKGLADIPNRDQVTFTADDLDWSSGSGPAVTGPAESLLLLLGGRDVLDELSGDGLADIQATEIR
ncbi:MAG: maleylpyruvate isomerase family mycothiol-dependent enzyme [Acidimicrobiales bacterium]